MWNPFKKKITDPNDPNKMGFLQKLAMKRFMSMNEEEKMKLTQKMMSPENVAKNKDKILEAIEQMKASGQISDAQIEEAKKKLGL